MYLVWWFWTFSLVFNPRVCYLQESKSSSLVQSTIQSDPQPNPILASKAMRSIDKAWSICRERNIALPSESLGKTIGCNSMNGDVVSWQNYWLQKCEWGCGKTCSFHTVGATACKGAGCRETTPAKKSVTVLWAGGVRWWPNLPTSLPVDITIWKLVTRMRT